MKTFTQRKIFNHLVVMVTMFIVTSLSIYCFSAVQPLTLENERRNYVFLGDHLEIFYDSSGQYTFGQISSPEFNQFNHNYHGIPHLQAWGKPCWWVRFAIVNQATENRTWFFELFDSSIDYFEVYIPDEKGGYQKKQGGDLYSFHQRELLHKNYIYEIPDPPTSPIYYYIKIQSKHPIAVVGVVRPAEKLLAYSNIEYFLLALFYGIAVTMILYNIFLFVNIRDHAYLCYVLLITSVAIYAMSHDGTGFQFIWPELPWLNNYIQALSLYFLSIWSMLYGKTFLNTREKLPIHNKIIIAIVIVRTVLLLSDIFKAIPYSVNIVFFDIACFIYLFSLGVLLWIRGFIAVRYYVTAFSILFTGFITSSLEDFNLIPSTIYTVYAMNIGAVVQMLLLSMALADKIKILLKEKEEVQLKMIKQLKENEELKDKITVELEHKVAQRTEEIKQMVKELELKNKELHYANIQLHLMNEKVNVTNTVLKNDNEKLATNLVEISKSRVLLQEVDLEEFKQVFPHESSCLNYLAELKWKDGFKCKKCGYTKTTKSKFEFGMRCRGCNYDESPTTDTLFHNLKFPVTKAFYMIYLVSLKDKKVKLTEISEMLDLRMETCWRFRKKIMLAKKNQTKQKSRESAEGWAGLIMTPVAGKV